MGKPFGRGRLSPTSIFRSLLGIRSRYDMDGFLKAHGVPLPTTLEQIVADSETAIAFSQ